MKRSPVLAAVDEAELRFAQTREARARVDAARILHKRLQREIEQLEQNPARNHVAIEAFRVELGRARIALREASQQLIRSI